MRFILFMLAFFFATTVQAAEIKFSWTPNTDATEGYRLYMDSGTNSIADIPGRESATTTFDAPDDSKCHSFALAAYAGDMVSDLSDFAVWCPDKPAGVQKFLLTLEPVQ